MSNTYTATLSNVGDHPVFSDKDRYPPTSEAVVETEVEADTPYKAVTVLYNKLADTAAAIENAHGEGSEQYKKVERMIKWSKLHGGLGNIRVALRLGDEDVVKETPWYLVQPP